MPDDPTARTLQLLALLQSGRALSSAEIAAELRVSPRTVRRDTERLRRLGYAVESRPGPGSGYRLEDPEPLPQPAVQGDHELGPAELAATVRALRREAAHDRHAAAALHKLHPGRRDEPVRGGTGRRRCALYGVCSTVRARMPSVARKLASGITGKMPLPR